jgi:hypothetical protein
MKSRLQANPHDIGGPPCTELAHHRSLDALDIFQAQPHECRSIFLGHAAHKAFENLPFGAVKRADEAPSLVIFQRCCPQPLQRFSAALAALSHGGISRQVGPNDIRTGLGLHDGPVEGPLADGDALVLRPVGWSALVGVSNPSTT